MNDEKMYSAREICDMLKISSWTLANWYRWEKKQLEDGSISDPYLPVPIRDDSLKGKPRYWTADMFKALKDYQSNIVVGRNGIYGIYSNPYYTKTQKYKKSVDDIEE